MDNGRIIEVTDKPRIRKVPDDEVMWVCCGLGKKKWKWFGAVPNVCCGYGLSPSAAYEQWRREAQKHYG